MDERLPQLCEFIRTRVSKDPRRAIEGDTTLVSSGLVDSLSLIQVLTFIEDEFQVVVPDEAATAVSMDTPNKIMALVNEYGS